MKQEQHAARAWIILVSAALNRQILNYKHLESRLGVPARGLASILGHILVFCESSGHPPLTSLVVRKDGGIPGEGFGTLETLNSDREKVFAYPWYDVQSPGPIELAKYWAERNRS